MKKITMIMAAVLLLVGQQRVSAQRPVGDTIIGADSTYMYYIYDWWRCANHVSESPQWYTTGDGIVFMLATWLNTEIWDYYTGPQQARFIKYDAGNNITGVQMVTDRPIKVLGVAACGYAQQVRDTTLTQYLSLLDVPGENRPYIFPNTRDTTLAGRFTDSLLLLKPTDDQPSIMAGGAWRPECAHRYMPLPIHVQYLMVQGNSLQLGPVCDSTPIVPLYEVLFDKPQVVTDSFIVAGTANNNDGSIELQQLQFNASFEYMWLWNKRPTRYWSVFYLYHPDLIGTQDWGYTRGQNVVWYKYRHLDWMRLSTDQFANVEPTIYLHDNITPNQYSYLLCSPAIFPIIDPDFDTVLCDMVRDVRMADSTDTTLALMWNGGNNVEWEVQYMEVNGWDVWTTTTTVPMVTLTGLRERTNYMVRVRGKCAWDTEYGEWSGWLDVYTGAHRDDPPQSVSNLERFTQMMPNPARGLVTVLSSYRLSRVVVYDLQGHAVLEQEDDGLATTLDVSCLAKGVYVVAIHTPAGIATKRLVVEGN
ncbi:MAG: T9SS type A sorting domain-containing protein [Bacteroidales bacterium]|nr:T9SS type A sorting domain-containing protein [Bacteroidales bacterium]